MKQGVFKYFFILGFIVLLIITYVVFYNNNDSSTQIQDQTSTASNLITDLRLGVAEFDTLNPIITNNKNMKEVSRLIFDSLLVVDPDYSIKSCLATEIAKSGDLTYIIKLRENVKWHDGTDFTAQDVKFTIDMIKNNYPNSVYAQNLQYVNSLNVVDSNTITIGLSQEVEFFEYNLTFPIVSSKYFENADFEDVNKNNSIVGTGMFKIEQKSENSIKLVKNEDYWDKDKDSLLKEINITLYSSIGEVYNAFKGGYIDIMNITIDNVEDYIGNLGYKKIYYETRNLDFLAFNTQNDVLSDPNVRKAIAYLIDKQNMISNLGNGYKSEDFLFTASNWLYDNRLSISYNSDEATNILVEDGWTHTNGGWFKEGKLLSFSITVDANNQTRMTCANVIKSQLEGFGIPVSIREVTTSNYYNSLTNKNYDAIISGIVTGFSPKISTLFSGDNLANYNNDRVNEIIESSKNTGDLDTLKNNYLEIYDIYLNEFPYIFLYRKTNFVVCSQTLCGNVTPSPYEIFYNVDKWYRQ